MILLRRPRGCGTEGPHKESEMPNSKSKQKRVRMKRKIRAKRRHKKLVARIAELKKKSR
jgi:hypothetical protein